MIARRSLSRTLVALCAVVGGLLFAWSAPALAQREHVFSKSFGSEGAGDGQLSQPGQLAVSEVGPAAGDVYVIDRGNDRVEVFDGSTGAYVTQFNGSASPTGAFSWPTTVELEFPREGAIAVDNSTNPLDPSAGDVYVADMGHKVIDKFSPSGAYIGQLTGTQASFPFKSVTGVAVDSNGTLWVQANVGNENTKTQLKQFNDALINEFVSETELKFIETNHGEGQLSSIGLAIDSEGALYVGHSYSVTAPESRDVAKLSGEGTLLDEEVGGEELATGVAVDRSSNDLYVDDEASVSAFTPAGVFVERFGSGKVSASSGVAVDSSTGTVYTSDAANQAIEAFTAVTVPDVSTGSVSNVGETTATLGGVVNPDGLPVTSCVFEYGTSNSYGQEAACSAVPGSGGAPVAVSAGLSGLEPLTRYHFRLKASNANGTLVGADRTFLTPVPVTVGEEAVSDVSATGALLSAQVNPGGSDTKFRFEYGTSLAYGQSVPVPEGDLGAGTGVEPVSVRPEDLLSGTTYHVRIAATGALGTVYGADETFTTQSGGGAFALPDGRMWEMVSPPDKYGAGIEPLPREGLVEASENGSAISYLASGPVVASSAGNPSPVVETQVLSQRAGGGWSSQDVVSPDATVDTGSGSYAEFLFFSPDLSQSLVAPPGQTPLSPEASEQTVYIHDDVTGGYRPLVTAGNVPPGTVFAGPSFTERVYGVTATPDLAHVLLTSSVPLTSNAEGGLEGNGEPKLSFYEWTDGRLALVNVLPNGEPTFARVSLGIEINGGVDVRHALSSDGSRVFWSSESEGERPLYMRETVGEKTVQVDEPAPGVPRPPASKAKFEIASASGSKVFFLDSEPLTADSKLLPRGVEHGGPSDLYVYDTEAKTLTDLTVDLAGSEPANVQDEVLGASEDGSVVYFVATGVLASGAEAGADNLYAVSESGPTWSAPRLIAVLSQEDEADWGVGTDGVLTAKVSPNGRFLAFMSDSGLTGYDNRDAVSGQPDEEVFLYDEANNRLRCVSCNPTGARPDGVFDLGAGGPPDSDRVDAWGSRWLAADLPTGDRVGDLRGDAVVAYESRYLSNEGRLFFNSFDSLVAQDTNGRADVYEYEPQAVGSCEQAGGCVSLISSGTSSQESTFLDASGKGPGGAEDEDVFFVTASRLVLQDYDTSQDVYDAHVCSSAVPCVSTSVLPPECSSGDSCKAAPSLQPAIFGAPSSATFSGSGNVAAPAGEGVGVSTGSKKKSHSKRKPRPKPKRKGKRKGRGAGVHKSLSARARR